MKKIVILALELLRRPLLILHKNKVPLSTRLGGGNFLRCSTIGNYCYLGNKSMINHATIGNYCSIAPHTIIGGMDHVYDNVSTSPRLNDECFYSETIIGHDVWIGANAIILQGVTIGDGCVIGAGSIVTKDIPENSIAVGVPAKVIRPRFTNERWQIIKASAYWNHPPRKARKVIGNID